MSLWVSLLPLFGLFPLVSAPEGDGREKGYKCFSDPWHELLYCFPKGFPLKKKKSAEKKNTYLFFNHIKEKQKITLQNFFQHSDADCSRQLVMHRYTCRWRDKNYFFTKGIIFLCQFCRLVFFFLSFFFQLNMFWFFSRWFFE